ncbi:hypothetical protein [Cupriavidus pinatubonensis]|uniref:hypothetical protein n=1 Tax=Cupriavidus pinatubonensis TaxID=248026 RepID=UPI003621D3D5
MKTARTILALMIAGTASVAALAAQTGTKTAPTLAASSDMKAASSDHSVITATHKKHHHATATNKSAIPAVTAKKADAGQAVKQ